MPTPMPTPYRNLSRDIETKDYNAQNLQSGIEDAKARFKLIAEQYHKNPNIPLEESYNRAYQDLLNRTNRMEGVKTKARELEIQQKNEQVPPKQSSFDRSPSSIDLSSIVDAFGDRSPAATLATVEPAPEEELQPKVPGPYAPPKLPPAQQAAGIVKDIRSAGVGAIGDKAQVDNKNTNTDTKTLNYLIGAPEIKSVAEAYGGSDAWKRQAAGLDDLEHLIALDAKRKAAQSSVDLSPMGAYVDAQNSLYGKKSNYATALKGTPIEETSLKDMGEIQRRRADMAKELINAVKSSKVGQFVDANGNTVAIQAGVVPNNMAMQLGRMQMSDVAALKKATDSSLKENDNKLESINQAIGRVRSNGPAEIASIPALFERMDTGSTRILAGLLGMEKADQAAIPSIQQWFKTQFSGRLTAHSQQVMLERLNNAAARAGEERAAKEADLREYSKSLRHLQPNDVENIVGSHAKMPIKGYPAASQASDPAKIKSEFEQFKKLMEGR
jgi:hypothetical protein